MSDYGFKTHDATNKMALNAKNPLFGFDMGHRPRAFKTFRITDAKQNAVHTGNVPTPEPPVYDGWSTAENYDHGSIRELIKKVEHGYNFRPVGYATITGTLKVNRKIRIEQTQRAGSYGGNYSRNFDKPAEQSWEITPNQFNEPWIAYTGIGLYGAQAILEPSDFTGTTWQYDIQYYFSGFYGQWTNNDPEYPIRIEIDDKYIYFYRMYNWYDEIRRIRYIYNGRTYEDLQERVKIADNFAGSTYNVTVYLCPYPLKELL